MLLFHFRPWKIYTFYIFIFETGWFTNFTFLFSTLDNSHILYFSSLRPILEHASAVWNSIIFTDTTKTSKELIEYR
jgi:hypothetical protein